MVAHTLARTTCFYANHRIFEFYHTCIERCLINYIVKFDSVRKEKKSVFKKKQLFRAVNYLGQAASSGYK